MTETVKTLIYVAAALVVALAAFVSQPRKETVNLDERIGQPLFKDFDDPAKAGSLEIVKYNAELGELEPFKVARDKASGAWIIPSHAGYPADAETRMRDAALMLVDLKVLGIASSVSGDHRLFGVIEPNKEKVKLGDEGVGLLVRFSDTKGQDLASVVIGKKVKGADDQRFVRILGQDVVYAVKIDPDQLSTKFEDWIERDLLKLNSWDVENVVIKDYAVERVLDRASLDRKYDVRLKYDTEWKLAELVRYQDNQPQPTETEVAAGKELNKDKLNDLKTAVDDLKIVDVLRKPKGLGRDLKAGDDFLNSRESVEDLLDRGFYPVQSPDGGADLLSANGEVYIGMKDGVEYVLRFGDTLAGTGEGETAGKSRYLLVTTRVDMAKFPQPELEQVPQLPAGTPAPKTEAQKSASEEATQTQAATAEPAAETPKPDAEPAPKAEPPKPDAEPAPAAESPKSDTEPAPKAETPKPDAEPAPAAEPGAKDEAKKPAEDDREAKEAELIKEQERITKENQRKLDEWNEKVKKAKERVAELNNRFGDWYYVVSETEYKKARLTLDDVFKAKEGESAAGEGTGVQDFRQLEEEGLNQ